jgi:hypothetical protein
MNKRIFQGQCRNGVCSFFFFTKTIIFQKSMDALGAYSSDDESDGVDNSCKTTKKASSQIDGSDEADSTDSSEPDEGDTHSADIKESKELLNIKVSTPVKEPEPKKRKLINPFEAMSSAKPSFLKSSQVPKDEVDIEDRQPIPHSNSKTSNIPVDRALASSSKAVAKTADEIPADFQQEADSKKKQETVRQKNNRKEKLGQAKFTLKANRDCPDIWRGT